jgi:cyclic 2,3-diphosphoglycerate synthetase
MTDAEAGGTLPRAVVLIDGEHYPPVVREALAHVRERFAPVAALFLGGEEKLRDVDPERLDEVYGLPVRGAGSLDSGCFAPGGAGWVLRELLAEWRASTVVDLSDEPVLSYPRRFRLISAAIASGARYVGADFEFSPQPLQRLSTKPALAVIGTGKRVGKTAVSGYVARVLSERYSQAKGVVVVAMGRGGPAWPQVVRGGGLGVTELLAASREGAHAASDHYEDAVLAAVTTIGCRRCGGGMAGAAFDANVAEGLALAEELPASIVIVEGSGSVIPPVQAEGVICVAGAAQPTEYISGYLGTYRMLISDLVVLTMCEEPFSDDAHTRALVGEVRSISPTLEVIPTVFRPRPTAAVAGERVAYFTTALPEALDPLVRHLEREHGAEVVLASSDLARRPALEEAVRKASHDADVFLTEIKAAAIDVVAEAAEAAGKRLVFCDNEPVPVDGSDLARRVGELAARCEAEFREEERWRTTPS